MKNLRDEINEYHLKEKFGNHYSDKFCTPENKLELTLPSRRKADIAILRSIGNSKYPILFLVCLLFLFFQINQKCAAKLKVKNIKRLADGTSPDLSFDGRYIAFNKKLDNFPNELLGKFLEAINNLGLRLRSLKGK
ncbi:MAG: hypothetical protein HQM10_16345 [Candidatus Riflebacteria bacterium]|nr:hypothetical protein [Candidatus Riflebacteria bacterium]